MPPMPISQDDKSTECGTVTVSACAAGKDYHLLCACAAPRILHCAHHAVGLHDCRPRAQSANHRKIVQACAPSAQYSQQDSALAHHQHNLLTLPPWHHTLPLQWTHSPTTDKTSHETIRHTADCVASLSHSCSTSRSRPALFCAQMSHICAVGRTSCARCANTLRAAGAGAWCAACPAPHPSPGRPLRSEWDRYIKGVER